MGGLALAPLFGAGTAMILDPGLLWDSFFLHRFTGVKILGNFKAPNASSLFNFQFYSVTRIDQRGQEQPSFGQAVCQGFLYIFSLYSLQESNQVVIVAI